jgi:hypothetical protein
MRAETATSEAKTIPEIEEADWRVRRAWSRVAEAQTHLTDAVIELHRLGFRRTADRCDELRKEIAALARSLRPSS